MLEKLKRVDWLIVLILICFMVASTLVIHSAVQAEPRFADRDTRNLQLYILGFIILFVMMFVDYRILTKVSSFIYGAGIVLLIAVYFFGQTINNARGWFNLGLFSFQPAELMKLAIIIFIAFLLSRKNGEQLELIRDVVPIAFSVFVPFMLVMMQPDLGNAIIYIVILIGMLWIGNMRLKFVVSGLIIAGILLGTFLYVYQSYHAEIRTYFTNHDKEHWVNRIDTFLYPEQVDQNALYHIYHAKIAIGTGGLTGEGYLQGEWVGKGFVPYTYSDSIFAVVAEEFGFIGSSVLLLLYFLLIYRMILISIQSSHLSGSYIIVGIVSMFVFQIFENVGMLMGLMPLTGITLPFISYGGTSLLINMASIGTVMSVKIHQEKKSMFQEE